MTARKDVEDEGRGNGSGFDNTDAVVFGLVIVILAITTYLDALHT